MNIERWVKTNRLTDEQLAIANELNERGIETFTDAVFSIGEPALAIISSSIAEPIAGLAGLGMAAFEDVNSGVKTIEQVKNALSYQPRTRGGKTGMKFVADTLQPVSDAFTAAEDYLGDNTLELTGSPLLAAGAATIPAAIAELNPLGKASKQATKMGIFAGKKAKTADLNKQAMAEELLNRGMDRDTIWKETGWFKDVDDHWKFEIDDSDAALRYGETKAKVKELEDNLLSVMQKHGHDSPEFRETLDITRGLVEPMNDKWRGILPQNVDNALKHKELIDSYPEAGSITASLDVSGGVPEGSFDPGAILLKAQGSPEDVRSTMLHELQHSIQESEGFSKGGTGGYLSVEDFDDVVKEFEGKYSMLPAVKKNKAEMTPVEYREWALGMYAGMNPTGMQGIAYDRYKRLAGEAEARNVQTRLDMTPEERAATPPWKTLDVPEDELILKDVSGLAMSDGSPIQVKKGNNFLFDFDPDMLEKTEFEVKNIENYKGDAKKPITVTKDGGKFKILDGHHRAKIAKESGDNVRAVVIPVKDVKNMKKKGVHPADMRTEWISTEAHLNK